MISLRDWNIGDSIRNNAHHQQAVLAIRELQRRAGQPAERRTTQRTVFIGKIVEEGEDENGDPIADYDDARYWVQILFIEGAESDESVTFDIDTSMKVPTTSDDVGPYPPNIFTATNVPELASDGSDAGCHLLSPGEIVRVEAHYDGGETNNLRLFFWQDPSPVTVHITSHTGCGKGHYNATATKRPTANINKASDLASAAVGAAGPVVIVRNLQEINRASADPWLTVAANADQLDFTGGKLAYVNSDGTAVIDFNGLWIEPCEEEEA